MEIFGKSVSVQRWGLIGICMPIRRMPSPRRVVIGIALHCLVTCQHKRVNWAIILVHIWESGDSHLRVIDM